PPSKSIEYRAGCGVQRKLEILSEKCGAKAIVPGVRQNEPQPAISEPRIHLKLLKQHWLIAGLVVVAIAIFAAFEFKGSDKPQYYVSKVDKGDIRQEVDATGTINAVTTVQVGSQVSGTIAKLYADFNWRVKKGQVIAQIDPALFEGALLQAKADYANAKANLIASQASLEKAKASAVQTRADYQRSLGLAQEGVISQQQLDLAKANADTNDAAVAAAEAQVTQAAAQVQLNATTVQNVVTYNTIIDFDNPELKLFPGMTAYITIPVATANSVLRVANGALRYKPDLSAEQIRALYQKYGLTRQATAGSA